MSCWRKIDLAPHYFEKSILGTASRIIRRINSTIHGGISFGGEKSTLTPKRERENLMANTLLVFNRNPYDGTDITWNGLRLADQLLSVGLEVNIFLMNDSVDLARDAATPPEGYFDLGKMLKELIGRSVCVKVCGTCKVRCGLHKGKPYFEGAQEAKMTELAQWIKEADKVISF